MTIRPKLRAIDIPLEMGAMAEKAEKVVDKYYSLFRQNREKGTMDIGNER